MRSAERDAELAHRAVAHHRERDLGAGRADRPDRAEGAGEVLDRGALDLDQDVAGVDAGLVRGAALGEAGDEDRALGLGGVHAEPGPRRAVDPAEAQQVVEDRREQVDRHDHVALRGDALAAGFLDEQRADALEAAAPVDAGGTAPARVRGRGEDRLIEQVLPVPGELALGDDAGLERTGGAAAARR